MIVYTANFGGKDVFKEPEVMVDGVRYVYYTDQDFKSDKWEVHKMGAAQGDSTLISRWYKMHSHKLFPGETTLWMDANLISIKDPTDLVWCKNLLVEEHLFRVDAYEEAGYCIRKKRGIKEDILRQVEAYRKVGYPQGYGLFTTRVLVRKPTELMTTFNNLWWDEIKTYSTRDQISFPFLLDAFKMPFDTIGHQEMKTYFLKKGGHIFRGTVETT